MLDDIEKIIVKNWYSHDVSFVFPSEVAASFWAKTLLNESDRKSVFTDRFISWDVFKGLYFRGENVLKPANKAARLLFALRYCQKKPRLMTLFPKDGSVESFAPYLAGILPQLDILDSLDTAKASASTRTKLADLKTLKVTYTNFLQQEGFFEPSWERIKTTPATPHYIFFPSVIDDFFEYETDLAAWKIPLEGENLPAVSSLTLHKTFYEEVHSVLDAVSGLLSGGTAVKNIVISCADLERVQGFLKSEAALRGIPLSVRQGSELQETVVGCWVKALSSWFAQGSFADLRTILLCGPFRLQDEDAGLVLLKAGIDAGCLYERPSKRWLDILEYWPRIEGEPETPEQLKMKRGAALYRNLVKKLENISKTKDLASWAGALQSLVSEIYDVDSIDEANKKIWEFYLAKLRGSDCGFELVNAAERSFLHDQYLMKEIYVQKATPGAIAVYPYRVAAGIRPEHHFVLNLDEKACRVEAREPDFFCDLEKADLGIKRFTLTDSFLKLYAQSGIAVYLSASAEGAAGSQSVPSSCLHAVRTAQVNITDRLFSAKAFWKGETGQYAVSFEELAAIKEWLLRREKNPGKMRLSGFSLHDFSDKDKQVYTAYQIKALINCPFSFFMGIVCKTYDHSVDPDILNGKHKGKILHRILENFLRECASNVSGTEPSELLERVIQKAERSERKIGSPFRELFFSSLDLSETASQLLALAKDVIRDPNRLFIEKKVTMELPELAADFSGRIDLLLVRNEGTLVLDLKSGTAASGACLRGEKKPYEMQVALYCLSLEGSDLPNLQGAYFSISDSKISYIKESGRGGEIWNTQTMRSMIEKKLKVAGEKIKSGCFEPDPDEDGCRLCDFRAVCRARFFGGWND